MRNAAGLRGERGRASSRLPAVAIAIAGWLAVTVHAGEQGQGGAAAAPQKVYKEWTVDELLPIVADLGAGRDWAQGRELFKKAACGICHAFARESEGTGLAPDLTGLASTST